MTKYEEFVLKKIKEVEPNAEEQDLHTGKFTLGGAWVAEILEDYEKQLHKQKASEKPSNCILGDVSKVEQSETTAQNKTAKPSWCKSIDECVDLRCLKGDYCYFG